MPVLAVVDEVDAGAALPRDDVRYGGAQPGQVLRLVGEISGRAPLVKCDQVLRPWQAARVAGQDPSGISLRPFPNPGIPFPLLNVNGRPRGQPRH
jgi:hypothetical protein